MPQPPRDAGPTLRRCRREDATALAGIESACFPTAWHAADLAAELGLPTTLALLAEVAGEVVGYALYRVVLDEAELLRLAVVPGSRRRGAARELLLRGDELLRARGCAMVFLEVREDNLPAIRLYEGQGWTRAGRRPGYYPDGAAALLYRRGL